MPNTTRPKTSYGKNRKQKRANWTIILFIAAENDLLEDMKDIYDQIAKVGSNPGEVNFVVVFDGLNLRSTKGNEGHVTIYHVTRYNYFTDVTDNCKFFYRFPASYDDLTNERNLVHVLSKAKSFFPAENYGLIFKGHGGPNPDINNDTFTTKLTLRKVLENGKIETDNQVVKRMGESMKNKNWEVDSILGVQERPIRGNKPVLASGRAESMLLVLYRKKRKNDRESKTLSYLTLGKVIEKVFCKYDSQQKKKLNILILDCCWGQTLENGVAFKEVTDYMVASADEMAILGIGYEGFCNFLLNQPAIKPNELANFVVAEYFRTEFNDYLSSPDWKYMGVSLTCVETTFLDEIISTFSSFAKHLSDNLDTHFYIIHLARLQCVTYTYELNPRFYRIYNIDLIWFLENLQEYNRYPSEDPVDETLDRLISKLLRLLSLYYIKSYLASNYIVKKPGEDGIIEKTRKRPYIESVIGGKGIGIIFPSARKYFDLSFYADIATSTSKTKAKTSLQQFLDNWEWANFLLKYVNRKGDIRKGNAAVKKKELAAFSASNFDRYLEYYNDGKHGTLTARLNKARKYVSTRVEHKWKGYFSVPKSK